MRDASFIFMGTGTSGGIPLIACDCATCTSDDPRDNRTRSGGCVTWVDDTGQRRVVLLDATPDLRTQAMRHNLWRCDAVLFTHNHVDHIFGLDELRRFNHVMGGEPIDIYAERYVLESLRRVYKHVFEQTSNVNKSFVATLITRELEEGVPVDIHGVRFTPIRLLHGRLPIFGFRIEPTSGVAEPPFPLAYCTDTSAIPTQTWALMQGLDTLVLDGLRHRHHPTHFTVDQACDAAAQIGARETYLTHIAHEIRHAAVEPTLPEGVFLGADGLVLGAALPGRVG